PPFAHSMIDLPSAPSITIIPALTMTTPRSRGLFTCLALLLTTACHQRPTVAPGYHEYAYVSNGTSNSVSVIDLLELRNVKTIAAGAGPSGIATSPTRNEIYVANADSSNVSIINAETNDQVAVLGVHAKPYYISVSSDGQRAYVANSGSANVSVI